MLLSRKMGNGLNRMSPLGLASRLIGLVVLAIVGSGCAVLGASRGTTVPPLAIPEAPPRVVAEFPDDVSFPDAPPVEETPFEEDPLVGTEVEARPIPQTSAPPAPEPVVTESPETAPDPPQLRPAPGLDVDEETVRRSLRTTARLLEGIDRTTLNATGRAQHDTARRFHYQATAALQAGNLVFAHYLNEKADTLVRDLDAR